MNRWLLGTLVGGLMAATASTAAVAFPDKPINVVVPTGPGGRVDTTARLFADVIQKNNLLSQPMVIRNVAGSGGAIGTRQVMTAAPDGYTVAFWNTGLLIAKAMGLADHGIDDFTVIAQTGAAPVVLATQSDSKFTDLKSLIDFAKEHPRTVLDATNIGTQPFFSTLMLAQQAGVTFRPVQVGGGAKRAESLMGHHSDIGIFAVSAFKQFEAGGLKALAVLSAKRDPSLPDVPTALEQGYDVVFDDVDLWLAPKGTPDDAVNALRGALKKAVEDPELVKRLSDAQLFYVSGEEVQPSLAKTQKIIDGIAAEQEKLKP